jgi:gamma-glutamylcyclotransferase (GGCT)/AIG2-like uncharacterized protein YtfP
MVEYLFVYGTLMKAAGHPMAGHLARFARYVGPATFTGRLYRVGAYPGVVASDEASDVVHGELYELAAAEALFAVLDVYEGCSMDDPKPHEYVRVLGSVTTGAKPLKAWIYLYNRPVDKLTLIASSRFLGAD